MCLKRNSSTFEGWGGDNGSIIGHHSGSIEKGSFGFESLNFLKKVGTMYYN